MKIKLYWCASEGFRCCYRCGRKNMKTWLRWNAEWLLKCIETKMESLVGHQWLERFGNPDRWWTHIQRHWWGPLSRMLTGKTRKFALLQHCWFLCAVLYAASAAAAARTEVIATYDAATVLVTVTFQVALRPSRHGIDVNPSGRFPSDLVNPSSSLTDGMSVLVNERQIKSFI